MENLTYIKDNDSREFFKFEDREFIVHKFSADDEHAPNEKYIILNNPKLGTGRFTFYTNRIKDAYECIESDRGDVILAGRLLSWNYTKVIRFLNREVGERLRAKFLKEFDISKGFYWFFAISSDKGFSGSEDAATEKGEYYPISWLMANFVNDDKIRKFNSEDEVAEFAKAEELKLDKWISAYIKDPHSVIDLYNKEVINDSYWGMLSCVIKSYKDAKENNSLNDWNWRRALIFHIYQGLNV